MKLTIYLMLMVSTAFYAHLCEAKISVVDVVGRTVEIEHPAEKVILGEGRFISIFSVLGIDQPISRIAGMMNEFELYDPDTYAAYQKVYPSIADIPYIGRTNAESVSLEKILLLKPDLAIFGLSGHGPSARSKHIIEKLEVANIPVAFVDFRQEPIKNTAKSVELVGRLLGEPAKAESFSRQYLQRLKNIKDRVSRIPEREYPQVLIDLKANSKQPCCLSVGKGMFADMANFAGGRSIASDLLKGPVGQLSYEHALSANFDIYIGTAIGSISANSEASNLLLSGTGVDTKEARQSLARVLRARKFTELPAIKAGHAHSLWHHFYNSPLNLYAIERMAKWFHPSLFKDLDPETTLKTLLSGAAPVDLLGAYSMSIKESK